MIDVGYWERVKAAGGAVPADRPVPQFIAELEVMLASPDAHERDEIGFEILGEWVLSEVCDADLVGLGDRMAAALGRGAGEIGTDRHRVRP